MTKAKLLRKLIKQKTVICAAAHDGLSAKLVEKTGFDAIWAGGFGISASHGVPDANILTMAENLRVARIINDASKLPVIADCDNGYGNAINVRRTVEEYEKAGIAAISIEDNIFPKRCSYYDGVKRELESIEEFAGKIKAAKAAQKTKEFIVIARVEALIAGWEVEEALKRARAYAKAGADFILIHSKQPDPSEILEFAAKWDRKIPLVSVPTKYRSISAKELGKAGFSIVIFGHETIRSAVRGMKEALEILRKEERAIATDSKIVPLEEIYKLVGVTDLEKDEKAFLPTQMKKNAIILAAAQGEQFGSLTREIPKALLKVDGKSILQSQIDLFNQVGIKDITIVRGFAKEKISFRNVKTIDNNKHSETTELYSLYTALKEIKENTIVCYGDILFKGYILSELLNDNNDITIVAEADYVKDNNYHDYVQTEQPYSRKLFGQSVKFNKMSFKLKKGEITGEFVGLFKVSKKGAQVLITALKSMSKQKNFRQLRMNDLFNKITKDYKIAVRFIKGSWLDINTIVDLQKAEKF